MSNKWTPTADQYNDLFAHQEQQGQTLDSVRDLVQQIVDFPFVAHEIGLGAEERELGQGDLWRRLKTLLGVQDICWQCGQHFVLGDTTCSCIASEAPPPGVTRGYDDVETAYLPF